MRKTFALLLISLVFCACLNQKSLNGFGNLKIGMSIIEFNNKFPGSKLNETETRITKKMSSLEISESLILKDVSIVFEDSKLAAISTAYNKGLFNILKNDYGIDRIFKSNGYETTYFNTNLQDIICTCESKNGNSAIIIFKKDLIDKI